MNAYTFCTPSHRPLLDGYLIPSIPTDLNLHITEGIQKCPSANFYEDGWVDCQLDKISMLISAIENNMGEVIMHLDSDIQFFTDKISDTLLYYLGDDDIIGQSDDRFDSGTSICSGMFVVRCNSETKRLFERVSEIMKILRIGDQDSLNLALWERMEGKPCDDLVSAHKNIELIKRNGGHVKLLPSDQFWSPRNNWNSGDKIDIPHNAIAHHANWCIGVNTKIEQLKNAKRKMISGLDPNAEQITAIILNWKREKNLELILEEYKNNPQISEVIVWNNNPDITLTSSGNINVINSSRDMGLDTRFNASLLAKTNIVLIQDDDLILPKETIDNLLMSCIDDCDRIHGIFGRNPREDGSYAIDVDQKNEYVDMVLTRALVVNIKHIHNFFSAISQKPISDSRNCNLKYGLNPQNGEDIIFSYSVYNETGKRHKVYNLPVIELPTGDESISHKEYHRESRTEILKSCVENFSKVPYHNISEYKPDVILSGGFFNRLNCLVTGRLTFGDKFKASWLINEHMPHSFEDIISAEDLEVEIISSIGGHPKYLNLDPSKGPLYCWSVSKFTNASGDQVKEAFEYFINKFKLTIPPSPNIGIHYRGLHPECGVPPAVFARWSARKMIQTGDTECFVLADSGREEIEEVFYTFGIKTIWCSSSPMTSDHDRGDLEELKRFVTDGIQLSRCNTILASFYGSTILDPARSLNRKIFAYEGGPSGHYCWFLHNKHLVK